MTDTAPAIMSVAEEVPAIDAAVAQINTGKECQVEGCDKQLPARGQAGWASARMRCDEHFVGSKGQGPGERKRKARSDAPPVDLKISLGGGPKGRDVASKNASKVSAGAESMAQTFAALVAMAGDPVCAKAIADGAQAWGKALGDLSVYQPALVKIFAPSGEATGQAFAWIAVMAATAGIAVPILNHHGVISDDIAAKFGMATGVAGGLADAPGA